MQRGEGMVRRIPALLGLVPLEHREVAHPEEMEISLLKCSVLWCIFLFEIETKIAAFFTKVLHRLVHDRSRLGPLRCSGQQPEIACLAIATPQTIFRYLT